MNDALFFFTHFLRNPVQISSVIPTSRATADHIASKIRLKRRLVIVEYGPGTGVLARAILRSGKLSRDSRIILIEKSKPFADRLRRTLTDPRVTVFHDSAEHVRAILKKSGEKKADYIFSSIPFSLIPARTVNRIVVATHAALRSDGTFIVFLCRFGVRDVLRKEFSGVKTGVALNNMPPLFIFEATKRSLAPKAKRSGLVTVFIPKKRRP